MVGTLEIAPSHQLGCIISRGVRSAAAVGCSVPLRPVHGLRCRAHEARWPHSRGHMRCCTSWPDAQTGRTHWAVQRELEHTCLLLITSSPWRGAALLPSPAGPRRCRGRLRELRPATQRRRLSTPLQGTDRPSPGSSSTPVCSSACRSEAGMGLQLPSLGRLTRLPHRDPATGVCNEITHQPPGPASFHGQGILMQSRDVNLASRDQSVVLIRAVTLAS
jgi:hypothetical protein